MQTLKLSDLPVTVKLSNKLAREAMKVGTSLEYGVENLDEVKRTVLLKFKSGGGVPMKLAEVNRNLKKGDWIIV